MCSRLAVTSHLLAKRVSRAVSKTEVVPKKLLTRARARDLLCERALLPALSRQFVGLEANDFAVHRLGHFGSHGLDGFGASF
jgi:hypothetical protein